MAIRQSARDFYLDGKETIDFLNETFTETDTSITTPADYADIYLECLRLGIIEKTEYTEWLIARGKTQGEIDQIFEVEVPAAEQGIIEEQKAHAEIQNKLLEKFCEEWNLDRIDIIVAFLLKNSSKLKNINDYWPQILQRYKDRRATLDSRIESEEDIHKRYGILTEELKRILFIYPSEIDQIFSKEQEHGSYVYLDSLLKAAEIFYETKPKEDPKESDEHSSIGNVGVSVSIVLGQQAIGRKHTLEQLTYGAKTNNEVSRFWKPKQKETAPSAPKE